MGLTVRLATPCAKSRGVAAKATEPRQSRVKARRVNVKAVVSPSAAYPFYQAAPRVLHVFAIRYDPQKVVDTSSKDFIVKRFSS
jgi:hypothetical protein